MSKRSRRKRRQRRRKGEQQALVAIARSGQVRSRLSLRVGDLELARGHDGFLRGLPEPTLLVGLYCADAAGARVIGRFVYRFGRPSGFPCKVAPLTPLEESRLVIHERAARFALVCLAVEEDSGRGVQSLFADLERVDAIVAWTDDGVVPAPVHLQELAHVGDAFVAGRRVHLLLGERDPARSAIGDDWVGASLVCTDAASSSLRLHFVSPDGKNDWTAAIALTARRA